MTCARNDSMDTKEENIAKPFWETKSLKDMTETEWESLCDGCGRCCYEKLIEGHGKKTKIYFTRIACNLLNLKTGKCNNYCNRFEIVPECNKLTTKNLAEFDWLPETCAYRLLKNGKPLPSWHPLISGNQDSVKAAGIQIKNGIHAIDAKNWDDYIIDEPK